MLHILLLILKIIGIVLLVILGLLLAAVLLVLLVPLRYRLEGSWHGEPAGKVRVTWLLHAVSVLASYENGLDITAKLFGFTVLHSASGGEENEEAGEAGEWDDEIDGEADIADGDEIVSVTSLETDNGAAGAAEVSPGTADSADAADSAAGDTSGTINAAGTANGTAGDTHEAASSVDNVTENISETADSAHMADSQTEETITEGIDISQLPTLEEELRQDENEHNPPGAEESSDDIIDKIENIFDRIGGKLEWADRKRRWIERFLEDPKNQKTIRLVWRQAKAMIRHILPQKASGQITFGFDDPATTGSVLAACSVLYALYGTELTITPDFENAVIDGNLQMKGRIRAGALAVRTVRVLIDRNLWRMIKKVRKFLESGGK